MSHEDNPYAISIGTGLPYRFAGFAKRMLALGQIRLGITPGKGLVDARRTSSKADDRLTPADTPFRRGRDVLVIRRPGSRPILRISKRKKKRPQDKPPPGVRTMRIERITVLPSVRRGPGPTRSKRAPARATTPPTRASQTAPKPKAIAKVEPGDRADMSIHKSILKTLGQAAIARAGRPKQAAIAPLIATGARVLQRQLPGILAGTALGGLFGGNGGANGGQCPSGWHLNKQDGVGGAAGTYCVRNRRMNFGNARAARRGVRRLKGARKLLRDIEKMMPSKPRARARPQHHHHPAAGG